MRLYIRVAAAGLIVSAVIVGGAWLYAASAVWFAPKLTSNPVPFEGCILVPPHGPTTRLVAVDPIHRRLITADESTFRVVDDFGRGRLLASRPVPTLAKVGDCWYELVVFDDGKKVGVRASGGSHNDYLAAFELPNLKEAFRFVRPSIVQAKDAGDGTLLVLERDPDTRRHVFWRVGTKQENRVYDTSELASAYALSVDKGLLTITHKDGGVLVLDARSGAKLHQWSGEQHVWGLEVARSPGTVITYVRDDPRVGVVARNLTNGKWKWARSLSADDDLLFHGVVESKGELIVETAHVDRDGMRRAKIEAWRLDNGELSRRIAGTFTAPFVYLVGADIKVVEKYPK